MKWIDEWNYVQYLQKKSSNVGQATEKVGRTLNWWYVNQIFSKFIHKFEAIEKIRIEKNGGR